MSKLKSNLGNIASIIYFVVVMWWMLLLLAIVPLTLFGDIKTIRSSGFSAPNVGIMFMGLFGLFIGISLLIPAFRKMYYKLPWLFPYVKILYVNLVIMGVATLILNYGYEVQSSTRHMSFFMVMIAQIVICRIAMCIYFNKKTVKYIGGGVENE